MNYFVSNLCADIAFNLSIIAHVACTILSAFTNAPDTAIPCTPADIIASMSSYSIPPIATIGINRESMRGEMQQDKDASAEDKENNKENMIDIFSTVSIAFFV